MNTRSILLAMLLCCHAAAQETPFITETEDRFTKRIQLTYDPDMPAGSPEVQLQHQVGDDFVSMTYLHLRPRIKFRHHCTTEGLADNEPFAIAPAVQYDAELLRQGFIEMVVWQVPIDLLQTIADANTTELRHCGIELYVQPGIKEGAAQMLQAIVRR